MARLASVCDARLATMHNIGLTFALVDPRTYDPSAIAAYAATAQAVHMGLIWIINDPGWWSSPNGPPPLPTNPYPYLTSPTAGQAGPASDSAASGSYAPGAQNLLNDYASLASSCGCRNDGQLERALIGMLAALPATQGYYLADNSQLMPEVVPAVSNWAARVRADDPNPNHILLIAHWGMVDPAGADFRAYSGIGASDVNEWYPVTTFSTTAFDFLSLEASMARTTHQISVAGGHLTAFFLQSFSWGDSLSSGISVGYCTTLDTPGSCADKLRFPSAAEMIATRNAAIGAGSPDLIVWYRFSSLAGNAYGPDPLMAPLNPTELSSRLAAFAQAVRAPAPPEAAVARAVCVRHQAGGRAHSCPLPHRHVRGDAFKTRP